MKPRTFLLAAPLLAFICGASASQLTNSVNVTPNMRFYVKVLGKPEPDSVVESHQQLAGELINTTTNNIWYRGVPYGRFDFHLFDAGGKEVKKTKAGLKLTATPPKPTEEDLGAGGTFRGGGVITNGSVYVPMFRPDDLFEITNPGTYELELRIRLCLIMTNGQPDLTAMVGSSPRNITRMGIGTNNQFGILTSPPLRIRVVKESLKDRPETQTSAKSN